MKTIPLSDDVSACALELTPDQIVVACRGRGKSLYLHCKSGPYIVDEFYVELLVQDTTITEWNRDKWVISRSGDPLTKEQGSHFFRMLTWHVGQNKEALEKFYLDEREASRASYWPGEKMFIAKGPIEAGASVVMNSDGTVSESREWQRRRAEREGRGEE